MQDLEAFHRALEELQDRVGYRFADTQLLIEALTHSSFANQAQLGYCNERLEFLGDSVLGLCMAEELYRRHPSEREGRLTKLKSTGVSSHNLARSGRVLGLDRVLRVGKAIKGGPSEGMVADAMEALIGAVYLDGGLEAARGIVSRHVSLDSLSSQDPKSALQEMAQRLGIPLPSYRLVEVRGPEHRATFVVQVWLKGELMGVGNGGSRREAESKAASAALNRLQGG